MSKLRGVWGSGAGFGLLLDLGALRSGGICGEIALFLRGFARLSFRCARLPFAFPVSEGGSGGRRNKGGGREGGRSQDSGVDWMDQRRGMAGSEAWDLPRLDAIRRSHA